MRLRSNGLIVEFREGHAPHVWAPQQARDCPHRACRRARKCMRPEIMPTRWWSGWPSCPLISDELWLFWSEAMMRFLGPSEGKVKEVEAICAKHLKWAAQRARDTRD